MKEAVALAIVMHHAGDLAQAETLYRRVLEAAPDQADAIHYLGILLHQREHNDESLFLLERSVALDPTASRYNNLGNVLVERGELEEAATAYRKSLELDASRADVHNNMGALLNTLGQFDQAKAAFEQALAHDARHGGALANLGGLYARRGAHDEAVRYFMRALENDPSDANARHRLGLIYYAMGEHAAAAAVYAQWLKEAPDHPVAKHMAAATGQGTADGALQSPMPARASDGYVEHTFDAFAASFDAKLARLSYRAPALVGAAVEQAGFARAKRLNVVDLGCGTGLCGPWLAPYASQLVGIDLSTKMLDAARLRGCYDQLYRIELTAFLTDQNPEWHLIVAADTLCYFGDLLPVMRSALGALASGGLFIFSVEAARPGESSGGMRLHPHGRYSHESGYVRRTLVAAGFVGVGIEPAVLRQENGHPVSGFVVVARKPLAGTGENP